MRHSLNVKYLLMFILAHNGTGGNGTGGNGTGGNDKGDNASNGGKPPTGGAGPSQSPNGGKKRKRSNDPTDGYGGGGKDEKKQKGPPRSEKLLKKEALLAQLDIEINAERQRRKQAREASAPSSEGMTEARHAQLEARHAEIAKAHYLLASLSSKITQSATRAEKLATTTMGTTSFTFAPYTDLQQSLLELSTLFTQAVAQLVEATQYQNNSWTPDQQYQNANARVKAEERIERSLNDLRNRLGGDVQRAKEAIHREAEEETRPEPTFLEREWLSEVKSALRLATEACEQHGSFRQVAIQDQAAAGTVKA